MFFATGLVSGDLVPGTLTGSCGDNPGIACRLAWDVTHSTSAAQLVRVYLAGPVSQGLRILFVVVVALVVRAVANRVINKITERAATTTLPVASAVIRPAIRRHRAPAPPAPPVPSVPSAAEDTAALTAAAVAAAGTERHEQRARALGSILRSGVSIVVFGIAALTILGDLGFNLTPLLLSTTVLGVALGFGAQNLIRDYLAGILMLVEDHYGVGDTINVKDATGTVEAMTLLTTRLRDVNGVVWHIRNGTIESVGNESQGWSRAVIDYPVPYGEDLARIRALMEQAAGSMFRERGWRKLMLEKPEVWGAQELSSKEVTMRIVAKTAPMRQWEVARELRARVKAALDAAGVAPAGPDTIVITAPSPNGGSAPSAASSNGGLAPSAPSPNGGSAPSAASSAAALPVSLPAVQPAWEGPGG
ncbi:MAG TPA: mechanosensitive ion channel family protein, partial [Streptosporangiaceae bacterium]|nr:mechanosensitive ion channel family protein [Streptosporangiaceae bacterium]